MSLTRALLLLALVSCAAPVAPAEALRVPCFVYAQRLPGVVYPLGTALHCDPTIPLRMTSAAATMVTR